MLKTVKVFSQKSKEKGRIKIKGLAKIFFIYLETFLPTQAFRFDTSKLNRLLLASFYPL